MALRSSQIDFIKTYGEKANPTLWAGFEVIGEATRTIATTRDKLNYKQRERIFDKVCKLVTKHYFDPKFNGTDWPTIAHSCRQEIVAIDEPEAFELAMHGLVRRLGTSHTEFFHQSVRRVPARLAVGATFSRNVTDGGAQWVTSDVHSGGPADVAGLRSGDVLVSVNDKPILPPEQPMFAMGAEFALPIRRAGEQRTLRVPVPLPRSRKQPYCEPRAVQSLKLDQNTEYLKVSILPGLLGLDVAREIDAAVAELSSCDRLVLDLRGHLGGGLGVLRLMSYLTPGKIPIGFTLSRKRAESGYHKEKLHGWIGYRLICRIHLGSPLWRSGSGGAIRLLYSYQRAWDHKSGTAGLPSS